MSIRDRRPASERPIRLFIVAEIRLFREGLEGILAEVEHIDVVGTAEPGKALSAIARTQPGTVLVDTSMPEGIVAVQAVLEAAPEARVVALVDRDHESDVIALGQAGVSGFITRDESLEELVATLEIVEQGVVPLPPRLATSLLRRATAMAAEERIAEATGRLTPREVQIGRLIGEGLSNKEIAAELSISTATVKNHVHNILMKLEVNRRSEAAACVRMWFAAYGPPSGSPAERTEPRRLAGGLGGPAFARFSQD